MWLRQPTALGNRQEEEVSCSLASWGLCRQAESPPKTSEESRAEERRAQPETTLAQVPFIHHKCSSEERAFGESGADHLHADLYLVCLRNALQVFPNPKQAVLTSSNEKCV